MNDEFKFFGEWVYFKEGDEADKEKARQYLKLWKEFLVRRLASDLNDYEKIPDDEYGEQWIDRPSLYTSPLTRYGTLGLKFAYKKKLPYQLT